MAFKGLFTGIDRYNSLEINWPSRANRDAKGLHELFTGGVLERLLDTGVAVPRIADDGQDFTRWVNALHKRSASTREERPWA